jgi:universal stress protein E
MQLFSNILVGVDPARYDPLDSSGQKPSVAEPVHWGIRLARANSARLLFFAASNVGEEALVPLAEEDRAQVLENLSEGGSKVLGALVKEARQEGVEAQSKFVPGKGWLEIIRQVLRDRHDLVVVGTRDLTKLGHIFFGNTSMKVLRRCPCPVLVARPPAKASGSLNILVATSLRPLSEQALRLSVGLAGQLNANLHVLHVVEYQLHDVCNIGLPDAKQEQYRRKIQAQAEQALQAQLEAVDSRALGGRLHVHLAGDIGLPDVAIQHFIEAHQIHLLIMGTITRGGIRGIMIGDTAERLLHKVSCSVLAVKPPDFICPVDA